MPIFALLSANAVSQVGNLMALVAVPWFVLQTTGSAAKTGLAGAAIALGAVLAGFLGGPVVDRLGFRRASVVADLMSGLTVALIPLLHLTVGLAFWQLLALVFLGSVLDAPGWSARSALVPDLANEAGMPVERANSADQAIPRLATLVGPPLAGGLIAAFGPTFVLFLDAATFACSAALVALYVPSPARVAGGPNTGGRAGYFTELLEGLGFVRGSSLLLSIVLVITAANLLDITLVSVVMPVYADVNYGSAVALGLMMAGHGAGALAGTILFGLFGHRLPRRPTFIIALASAGPLPYLMLAATPPLYATVGVSPSPDCSRGRSLRCS